MFSKCISHLIFGTPFTKLNFLRIICHLVFQSMITVILEVCPSLWVFFFFLITLHFLPYTPCYLVRWKSKKETGGHGFFFLTFSYSVVWFCPLFSYTWDRDSTCHMTNWDSFRNTELLHMSNWTFCTMKLPVI